MIRVECPIGCAGYVPRPYRLRREPVRCRNCTAWFRVAAEAEDGGLVSGVLLAAPGEPLAAPAAARRSLRLGPIAPYAMAAAAVGAALVAGGPGAAAAAGAAFAAGAWLRR